MLKNWIIGKLGNKSKGKAYLEEIQNVFSPENILKADPEEEVETKTQEAEEHETSEGGKEDIGEKEEGRYEPKGK